MGLVEVVAGREPADRVRRCRCPRGRTTRTMNGSCSFRSNSSVNVTFSSRSRRYWPTSPAGRARVRPTATAVGPGDGEEHGKENAEVHGYTSILVMRKMMKEPIATIPAVPRSTISPMPWNIGFM